MAHPEHARTKKYHLDRLQVLAECQRLHQAVAVVGESGVQETAQEAICDEGRAQFQGIEQSDLEGEDLDDNCYKKSIEAGGAGQAGTTLQHFRVDELRGQIIPALHYYQQRDQVCGQPGEEGEE